MYYFLELLIFSLFLQFVPPNVTSTFLKYANPITSFLPTDLIFVIGSTSSVLCYISHFELNSSRKINILYQMNGYMSNHDMCILDILFSSKPNIHHKSSCGLCFWASGLLNGRFY